MDCIRAIRVIPTARNIRTLTTDFTDTNRILGSKDEARGNFIRYLFVQSVVKILVTKVGLSRAVGIKSVSRLEVIPHFLCRGFFSALCDG